MDEQERIKRIRESALSMEVGDANDRSAITGMMSIGGLLHIIKENGIYECRLADDIDPQRTNPNVPNVQQKILSIGSNSDLTARTLLTAKQLFDPKFLLDGIDTVSAITLSLSALKDIAAMDEIRRLLVEAENKVEIGDRRGIDRSVTLPSVGDVLAPCKSFIQKSDHAVQSLFNIAKIFYGNDLRKGWIDALQNTVERKYGDADQFSDFMRDVAPFLRFIRYWRNSVEHPKPTEYVIARDFTLNSKMQLFPPTIEMVHPKAHQEAISISSFMHQAIEQISKTFEMMIAFMCSKHVKPFSGFPIQLLDLQEFERREKNVRFAYGIQNGDQVMPIS